MNTNDTNISRSNSIYTNVTDTTTNVPTTDVAAKTAKSQGERIKLTPPAPFAALKGQELSIAKKVSNKVFAPLLTVVYAPAAAYKNSLLKKQEVLTDKFNKMGRDSGVGPELKDVNKKLEGVDKLLKNLTETKPTLNHELKNINTLLKKEIETLQSMELGRDVDIERISFLESQSDEVPSGIKASNNNYMNKVSGDIENKAKEIKDLESQAKKIEYKLASSSEKILLHYENRKASMEDIDKKMNEIKQRIQSNPEEASTLNEQKAELMASYIKLVQDGRPLPQTPISISHSEVSPDVKVPKNLPPIPQKPEVQGSKPLPPTPKSVPKAEVQGGSSPETAQKPEIGTKDNKSGLKNKFIGVANKLMGNEIKGPELSILDKTKNAVAGLEKDLQGFIDSYAETQEKIDKEPEGTVKELLKKNQIDSEDTIAMTRNTLAMMKRQVSKLEMEENT
ncbi:MAG TPA: hypothetical protein VGP47_09900 [Parachlamydiaceae bacterium]|nr:hypothetical protein [Parachlamydiaceae bacterium]